MDTITSPKAHWSILKTFLNNKKIPCVLPIYHNKQIFHHFLFNIRNYSPEVNISILNKKKRGVFLLLYATDTKQGLRR